MPCSLASTAAADTLRIFTDTSDPAPKKAFQTLINDFENANPDVKVKWTVFDHEGYKTSIRNFLSADAPDLANWYAGNRMAPFVKARTVLHLSGGWQKKGLAKTTASPHPSMAIHGHARGRS